MLMDLEMKGKNQILLCFVSARTTDNSKCNMLLTGYLQQSFSVRWNKIQKNIYVMSFLSYWLLI